MIELTENADSIILIAESNELLERNDFIPASHALGLCAIPDPAGILLLQFGSGESVFNQ